MSNKEEPVNEDGVKGASLKEVENGSRQSIQEHDTTGSSSNEVLEENQNEATDTNESKTMSQALEMSEISSSSLPQGKLKSLTEEISKLTSLKELDISHNELQEIPESTGDLQNLVTLLANNNCLTKLPSKFSSLCNLEHLNLRENKLVYLPSDMHFLLQLKDIDFDENILIRPPLEVCKGKQLPPIIHYLENADQRDEKVLEKILKTISKNIPLEHLDHFCRKMQLDNDTIIDIENHRSFTLEDKVAEALNSWKKANENLSPTAMVDQMIRILIISGLYYLSNKIKALKLCSRVVKF